MTFRELAVPGAWEITPAPLSDSRGTFFEWFTESAFAEMAGHHFDLRQANCSTSAAGALRGLHFAQLPPGQAKYVTCVRGAVFDVVVVTDSAGRLNLRAFTGTLGGRRIL
jgi:dTDP-4-dehydrorhamnose 3,5-epimerase